MGIQRLAGFNRSLISGENINYEWTDKIFLQLTQSVNDKLYETIDMLNFKAKMSIAVIALEWGVWLFEDIMDISDGLKRIEAAWAGIIDPLYIKSLEIKSSAKVHDTDNLKGPLMALLYFLHGSNIYFSKGNIYLAQPVMKSCMLSRYLSPDKKVFDSWLSDILKKTQSAFPNKVKYDKKTKFYDASNERSVPRVFFEPSFKYSEEESQKALNSFLRNLDYSSNMYLNKPDDIKKAGFKGEPYTY
jgi:hypothetical protein